jgi:diguanylate cyclase (GGDEF)-like protein
MQKFWLSGLRLKLVGITLAGVVTAFAVIGSWRVYDERQRVTAEMTRLTRERADLVAEAVANLVVGYDYSNLESLAERLIRQQDMQAVVVRNRQGKTMVARSRPRLPDEAVLGVTAPVRFGDQVVGEVELTVSLARLQAEIAQIYRSVLVEQAFFVLFLGLLIYLGTSRFILQPIARLTRQVTAMAENPQAPATWEAPVESRDELGELARVFRDLQDKVQETQARLREKIDLAGTALMRTNEQLAARTQELESRTAELEKALALVEKLAVTDSLTGLRNRRYFDDSLEAAFARAQRFGEPLCLLLVDVDHFKQINDRYGHPAGDAVLQGVAAAFRSRTRETDVVARLGGDEFAFLLYRTTLAEGRVFGDSLLALAKELRFTFDHDELTLSLSIGVAAIDGRTHSIEALYGAADQALYEAKRQGRGRLVAHPFPAAQEPNSPDRRSS